VRSIYCARYDFIHGIDRSKIQKFKDSRVSGRSVPCVNEQIHALFIILCAGWFCAFPVRGTSS
jgi:hypothetical protein